MQCATAAAAFAAGLAEFIAAARPAWIRAMVDNGYREPQLTGNPERAAIWAWATAHGIPDSS